jgi:hypothetical protein
LALGNFRESQSQLSFQEVAMKALPFHTSGTLVYGNKLSHWAISPARYAHGQCALSYDSAGGYKTDVSWLAEGQKARWSNRDRAYILSPSKAQRITKLLEGSKEEREKAVSAAIHLVFTGEAV